MLGDEDYISALMLPAEKRSFVRRFSSFPDALDEFTLCLLAHPSVTDDDLHALLVGARPAVFGLTRQGKWRALASSVREVVEERCHHFLQQYMNQQRRRFRDEAYDEHERQRAREAQRASRLRRARTPVVDERIVLDPRFVTYVFEWCSCFVRIHG